MVSVLACDGVEQQEATLVAYTYMHKFPMEYESDLFDTCKRNDVGGRRRKRKWGDKKVNTGQIWNACERRR